jgi:hypothetical protein
MVEVTQEAREAAAQVFDARAKKNGHPEVSALERYHAKRIRQGNGDDYDAVQAAQLGIQRGREQAAVIADEQADFHTLEVGLFNDKGQIESRDFAKTRAEKCSTIAQAIRNAKETNDG